MATGNKQVLGGIYRRAYCRAAGESSASAAAFVNIDMTNADFVRRLGFAAAGERFAVPGTSLVVRWVRARSTGIVAGGLVIAYAGRTGTASAGSASTLTAPAATQYLLADIGGGIISTTGGTGPNQNRDIVDSDEAATSLLTVVPPDLTVYVAAASLPEAFSPVIDATTTFGIYCPWEVQQQTAATDLVTGVALGTVTNGNWTLIVEEGPVPTLCVGSTDALVALGRVVPSATANTAKGPTAGGITASEASLVFGRSLFAYSGAAALRLVDVFGRFKQ